MWSPTYPHDPAAFTQGLQWHDGRLFESTGEVGTSSIREVDLTTGRVIRKRDLAPPHFGEGIVILGDKLYQITWKTDKAFVYDWKTFAPTGEFTYEGEGWGLTTDGTSLIMSDGTSTIRWRDPATFAVQKSLDGHRPWYASDAAERTGVGEGRDLGQRVAERPDRAYRSGHRQRAGLDRPVGILPAIDRTGKEDVLNGIAYDAAQGPLLRDRQALAQAVRDQAQSVAADVASADRALRVSRTIAYRIVEGSAAPFDARLISVLRLAGSRSARSCWCRRRA